jgi:hypothetical protein
MLSAKSFVMKLENSTSFKNRLAAKWSAGFVHNWPTNGAGHMQKQAPSKDTVPPF